METSLVDEIASTAIESLREETGLSLAPVANRTKGREGSVPDLYVRIGKNGEIVSAVVKRWLAQASVSTVLARLQETSADLLVADYVSPPMARRLREHGVQFIDMAGNAWIDRPPVFVSVTGRRPRRVSESRARDAPLSAFESRGMIVVHALLMANIVNRPYREIAELTGVSVGTVGRVINGLAAEGMIIVDGARRRVARSDQHARLMTRWLDAWPTKLRPKQYVGTYASDEARWFEQFDLSPYDAYWGGETAAERYMSSPDGYVPRRATVYIREEDRARFMRDARLRKARPGEESGLTDVLRPFWSKELYESSEQIADLQLVDPLLACADMGLIGDARASDAAIEIYRSLT